jgi:hypothetical protein
MSRPPFGFKPESLTRHSRVRGPTLVFVFMSIADLLMTYVLLRHGGPFFESNPIAQWFFERWNVTGLVAFKFVMLIGVVTLGEVIEHHRPRLGRLILLLGAVLATYAFVHGIRLFVEHA